MSDLKLGISDLNSVIRRILGEEWEDITHDEVEERAALLKLAPYPWCRGNPTIQHCIQAGHCQKNPTCGD